MKRILFICILFCFGGLLASEQTAGSDQQKLSMPNPLKLDPEWWKYFEGSGTGLQSKLDKFYASIDQLLLDADPDVRDQYQKTSQNIRSNLKLYAVIRQIQPELQEYQWVPKEGYPVSVVLELSNQIRKLKQQVENDSLVVENLDQEICTLHGEMKTKMAVYLSQTLPSKEKFSKGLNVMLAQSRLAYMIELKRIEEALLMNKKQEVQSKSEELSFAKDHVMIESGEPTDDESQIAELKGKIQAVRESITSTEAKFIDHFIDQFTPGDQDHEMDQIDFFRLKLDQAQLEETELQAKIYNIEILNYLNLWMTEPDANHFNENLNRWNEFLNENKKRLSKWKSSLSKEISEASKSFVKAIDDQEVDQEYRQLLQKKLITASNNSVVIERIQKQLHDMQLQLAFVETQQVSEASTVEGWYLMMRRMLLTLHENYQDWLYWGLFDIGGIPITPIGILKALTVLLFTFFLSGYIQKGLRKLFISYKVGESSIYILLRLSHYAVLLIGSLFALSALGLTLRNFAIVVGALGIGIGFGLQNFANNFLSGLSLLVGKHIKVGDIVELEETSRGKVTEINVLHSTIRSFDGLEILVPNSILMNNKLVNWTKKDPYRRFKIPFGVAYGVNQHKVKEIITEIAREVPGTMVGHHTYKDPEVWLVKLGDSSMDFELVVWVNLYASRGQSSVTATYLSAITDALLENGIDIPFPQQDIHIKSLPKEYENKVKS